MIKERFSISEFRKQKGLSSSSPHDVDEYYAWRSDQADHFAYLKQREELNRDAMALDLKKHNSVLEKARRFSLEKIAGFVVFADGFAQTIHQDKDEAQLTARAFSDFHNDVRIRRVKV